MSIINASTQTPGNLTLIFMPEYQGDQPTGKFLIKPVLSGDFSDDVRQTLNQIAIDILNVSSKHEPLDGFNIATTIGLYLRQIMLRQDRSLLEGVVLQKVDLHNIPTETADQVVHFLERPLKAWGYSLKVEQVATNLEGKSNSVSERK